MRSSTLVVVATVAIVIILILSTLVVTNAISIRGLFVAQTTTSTTTVSTVSISTVTVNNTLTSSIPTTVTSLATTTSPSVSTVTVTQNYTNTTTVYTAVAADPKLVRANGYFLTTPADMMQWNNSIFSSFVQNLIQSNVTYLYFNLPNVAPDGSLQDNFTLDSSLILRFYMSANSSGHSFQYIAWTGTQTDPDAVLGNYTSSGVNQTVNSVYSAGFGGILLDLEPVPNDSPQFLGMLNAFRSAMNQVDPGMLLGANSMAVYAGEPAGHEWGWDPNYFQQVTSLLNFTSPMLFESGTETESQYVQYVVGQIEATAGDAKCALIYAIPNWYANTTWHNPLAENISNAVVAFRTYVDNGDYPPLPASSFLGLAIYGLNKTYTLTPGTQTQALETTPSDWSYFVSQWVNSNYPTKIESG